MGDRLDLLIPLNHDAIGCYLRLLSAGAPSALPLQGSQCPFRFVP
jgi:hypothetical protein